MTTNNGLLRNSSGVGNPSPFHSSSSSSSSSLDGKSAATAPPPGWGAEDGGRIGQGSGPSARWRGDGGGVSSNNGSGGGGGSGNADKQLSRIDAVPLPSSSPPPSRFSTERGGSSGDGRGDGGGRVGGGGEGAGGGMAWDFKQSIFGWEQPNAGTGGSGRRNDGRMDNGSSTVSSAWNNFGPSGDSGSGGGGRETRVGIMRPVDNDSNGAAASLMNGVSSFAQDGRGSWVDGDADKRDGEGRGPMGGADVGAIGASDGHSVRAKTLEYTDSRHHHHLSGDIGDANGTGSNGTRTITNGGSSSSKAGLGIDGIHPLRMSLADSTAGEGFGQETTTTSAAHLHQRDGNASAGHGGAGHVHSQNHGGSSEPGLGLPSSSASSTTTGGYLHENGVGGGVLSPFKFASATSATSATSVSSPATFNSTSSSAGSGGEGSASMASLATISAAATAAAAAAASAAADADRDCMAGRQGGGNGTATVSGGGGGREEEGRCKMCWMG